MTEPTNGMRIPCIFHRAKPGSLCNKWIGLCSNPDTTIYQDFCRPSIQFLLSLGCGNTEPSLDMRTRSVGIQPIFLLFENSPALIFFLWVSHNSAFGPRTHASYNGVLRISWRKCSSFASALAPSSF